MGQSDSAFEINTKPETLIGTPSSSDQSAAPYGLDKSTELEANDGSLITLGDLIAQAKAGGNATCVNITDVTVTTEQVTIP